MDVVATHTGTTTDGRDTKNGKKRAKEMEPREEKEGKRVKIDEGPSDIKVTIKKVLKQNAQGPPLASNENSTAFNEPKWKSIKSSKPPEAAQSQKKPSLTKLKPRIWTSSREELVVLLPELAGPKCLNGVSWLMYDTPMILLDESDACFDISLQEDSVTLDLLTTREFTCIWPPRPEKMPDSPRNSTMNDINGWNLGTTATSSSIAKLPKTRSTPSAPAAGSTKLTQVPPEGTAIYEYSLPLHIPHELSMKDPKVTRSERFVPPSLPTYSQYKPPVETVSQSYGTGTKVLGGALNHGVRGRRRIEAAGFRMETPEMSFSPPSVPHYAVYGGLVAGFFGEPVRYAQSLPETGNTAIIYQHEATKIREQGHFANALTSTHSPLQVGRVVNDRSNILRSQGRAEFANNQPPIFCTSCQPGPSWIDSYEPLSRSHPPYETQCTVSTDTITETVEVESTVKVFSDEATIKQTRDVNQDTFIPSTLPKDIQAIIDSYLSGSPVLLIISNKRFFDCWSLCLPEEFGFSMLGYFRILGVQESRVNLNDPVPPLIDQSGLLTGRVKWRFQLQWSPGGEEWILPSHNKDLLAHPWWKPPLPLSVLPLEAHIPSLDTQSTDNLVINPAAPGASQDILASEPFTPPLVVSTFESQSSESTFDTTPRYRVARLSNVNYKFRHVHLRELYHSLVPLPLLAPYGRKMLDSSFPRGWLCESCGKMNFQAALRHRMCSSSFCKGLQPEVAPYAIELMFMRDPQDNLSMVLPYNEPLLINLVDTWEDGTRTLPYYIYDDKNIFIKHIFTRNLPLLQVEATRLLHFIQLEVELVRPIGENSPYFQYSAHAPKDDPSPTTSKWPNVPLSIHHAKDWTQHQAISFGELKEEQLSINHLCLLAWVSSGTRRGPATIRAKEKCVIFHAFGCNITVMVTPLSSKTKATAPVKVDGVDIDSLNLINMDDLPQDEPEAVPGWIAGLDEDDDAVEHHPQEEREPVTTLKKTSNSKRSFLFTLVHGDVLIFYGDDFEYSLKRAGTSFLLIASHQNEP